MFPGCKFDDVSLILSRFPTFGTAGSWGYHPVTDGLWKEERCDPTPFCRPHEISHNQHQYPWWESMVSNGPFKSEHDLPKKLGSFHWKTWYVRLPRGWANTTVFSLPIRTDPSWKFDQFDPLSRHAAEGRVPWPRSECPLVPSAVPERWDEKETIFLQRDMLAKNVTLRRLWAVGCSWWFSFLSFEVDNGGQQLPRFDCQLLRATFPLFKSNVN